MSSSAGQDYGSCGYFTMNFDPASVKYLLRKASVLHRDQIVLITMDNTTVVSYINKKGSMRSGSLCALLFRLLSWCHPRGIVLRSRHIPGRLNVIALTSCPDANK